MSEPVVSVRGLTHRFGDVVALTNLDLDVPAGVTGLVGANGAGKTTLLRVLLGLVHASAGSATVMGYEVRADPIAVRSLVGYMPEGSCIPKDQTAADFVSFAAELAGVPPKDARRRASETLFLVGLEEERFRYLGDFSTGMQQRVKLAQSIVHGPRLVLLDEPAAGLDPAGRAQMLSLIRRLGGFGINVIVSSHVLTDIEDTCDSVVMLAAGRLIRAGALSGRSLASTISVEVIERGRDLADHLASRGFEVSLAEHTLLVTDPSDDAFDAIRDAAVELSTGILRLGRSAVTLEDEFLESAES